MKRSAVLFLLALQLGLAGCEAPSEPIDLERYEGKVFSQFGEDGVIRKIFQVIEPTHRYSVEFGAADGVWASNTRNLILNQGWGGLFIEGDPKEGEKLHANYRDNPRVTTMVEWVYPGNVELLFEQAGVPHDFDLLSVDIDSNDYYVWRAIRDYRPKVVVMEFNAGFPPPKKMVIKYHPLNYFDETDYYGASIQSMYELGKKKGYELIYCERRGNNLFFVDGKYFERFGIEDNSPETIYRLPQYVLKSGGRAPNGRGHIPAKDGEVLLWENVTIEKEFILDRY